MSITLTLADWGSLFLHFISLSLLAVGGAITTAPDIHRYLVDETHWLTDAQFTSSIALAQGAPGPNVMFVALMGWNVGLNAGGGLAAGWPAVALALWGVLITMVGIMIPSCTLTFVTTQWAHRNREMLAVKAFKSGMAPIVIALLITTGWLLTGNHENPEKDWPLWALTGATTLIVWKTKTHLLILLGAGAFLGAMGWI
jgi:chromate transporter